MRLRFLYVLVAVFILAALPAYATTYWVATTGLDSNACSAIDGDTNPGTHKLTWASVKSCIVAGDTVVFLGGTYTGVIAANDIPSGTSWSSPTTVKGAPGETVIFRATTTGDSVHIGARQYIVLDNLTIDGVNNGTPTTSGGQGIRIGAISATTAHIRVQNSIIKNFTNNNSSTTNCITHQYNATSISDIQYIGNQVFNCGNRNDELDHGFYIWGNDLLLERNTISDAAGYGIQLYQGSSGKVNNAKVRYNLVHTSTRGILIGSGDNNVAHDNIVRNSTYMGIRVGFGNPTNNQVWNNSIYANGEHGIYIDSEASNTTIKNNILHGNGFSNAILVEAGASTVQAANLQTASNPWVNVAGEDFNLTGAGGASDGVDDGVVSPYRPGNNATDQGAHEAPLVVSCEVGLVGDTTIECTHRVDVYSPLVNLSHAGCTATVAAAGRTINSSALNGTSKSRFVLASAVTAGQAVTLSCPTVGWVQSTASIGGTLHSKARASGTLSVVNNVAVAPSSATIVAHEYRWGKVIGDSEVFTAFDWHADANVATGCGISSTTGCIVVLRWQIRCTVATCPDTAFELRFAHAVLTGGSYNLVPATPVAGGVAIVSAAFVPPNTETTRQLATITGIFHPGLVLMDATARPTINNFLVNDATEMVWVLRLAPGASGAFTFRPYRDGGIALGTYTQTATLTPRNPRSGWR